MKKRILLLLTVVVLGVVLVVGVALAANFTGTAGPNRITGTGSADNIDGGGGADILNGAEGPDKLFAAFGVDALRGGKGDDLLVTFDRSGGDTASGGDGVDTCVIDQGDNVASCEDINPEVTVDQPYVETIVRFVLKGRGSAGLRPFFMPLFTVVHGIRILRSSR